MYFKVKEFLLADYMKGAVLLGGKAGINRHINRITVFDSPDGMKFLKGNEIVLTSSYALIEIENMANFMNELYNANVSCMAFKNKYIGNITSKMIEIADELDFPLIEVPKEITWAEIISEFYCQLFSHQYEVISFTEKVHTTFNDMVLNGVSIDEIAKKLYELIRHPVVLLNEFYEVMDSIGIDLNKLNSSKNISETILQYKLILNKYNYCYTIFNNSRLLIKQIGSGTAVYGYLLVILDINEDLEVLQMKAIEYASTVMTLELIHQRQNDELEKRLYGNFLNNILTSNFQYDKNILRKAQYLFGYHEDHDFKIIVVDIDNFAEFLEEEECPEDRIQRIKIKIERSIKTFFGNYSKKVFISTQDDNFFIFFPTPDDNLFSILKELKVSLARHLGYLTFSVGISRTYKKLEDIKKGYEESTLALETGRKVWGKNKIFFYDDLGLYLLLIQDSINNDVFRDYITNKFSSLLKYDRSKSGALLRTLDNYFKSGMNINAAAKKLYVHPKTVKYRLDKIADITGVDFNKQDDRLILELVTKLVLLSEDSFIHQG